MNTPQNTGDPRGTPALVKAAQVARRAGLPKRTLLSEIEAGRIPIGIVRIGMNGVAYLNRADSARFLETVGATL
ncbi:hypothetical protein [Rubrivivax albus]|uniref:DNA-binding protein n=1 Tax=Rubrivivax albus TaxID=2499835 RepID=A0A3S2UN56_9BURK|nr:hypothetical protein [Rubrivivax albus]RVT49651.1 hypothetical protein ENE75_18570 [Rubrivivax albus]